MTSAPLSWSLFRSVVVAELTVERTMAMRLKLLMAVGVPSLAEPLWKPARSVQTQSELLAAGNY